MTISPVCARITSRVTKKFISMRLRSSFNTCFVSQRMVAVASEESEGGRGYPEYTGSQGPGLLCAGVLDVPSARIACATTSEMFLHRMIRVAPPNGTRDVFYRGRIECTGDEADITDCSVGVEPVAECPRGLVHQLLCTSCKQQKPLVYVYVS